MLYGVTGKMVDTWLATGSQFSLVDRVSRASHAIGRIVQSEHLDRPEPFFFFLLPLLVTRGTRHGDVLSARGASMACLSHHGTADDTILGRREEASRREEAPRHEGGMLGTSLVRSRSPVAAQPGLPSGSSENATPAVARSSSPSHLERGFGHLTS